MAINDKQHNGAPYQKRYGNSSYNNFRVRNNGFTLEGSGTNPIKGIKKMADIALINYGAMKQTDLNTEFGRRMVNGLLDTIFGGVVKTAITQQSSTSEPPEQDPDNPILDHPLTVQQ